MAYPLWKDIVASSIGALCGVIFVIAFGLKLNERLISTLTIVKYFVTYFLINLAVFTLVIP